MRYSLQLVCICSFIANKIGVEGACAVGTFLRQNMTLTKMDLSGMLELHEK